MKKNVVALLLGLTLTTNMYLPVSAAAQTSLQTGYSGQTVVTSTTRTTGKWFKNSYGWWFKRPDGSYPVSKWEKINGCWYYFDQRGYCVTGWKKLGQWYYFNADGIMQTGWEKINGSWYYFNSSGAMQTGWLTLGNNTYYLNSSGAMACGWKKIDNHWYYFNSSGAMCEGWKIVGQSCYYLAPGTGIMKTGWLNHAGQWYYLGSDGAMKTNQWIGNYYVDQDGVMVTNQWIGSYYVDSYGKWVHDKEFQISLGNGKYTTVTGHFDYGYANSIIELVNEYREIYDLGKLTSDPDLTDASTIRASEIAYYFEHIRPNSLEWYTAVQDDNFCYIGENIAKGFQTPEAAMNGWKNSPSHNENMLHDYYDSIGVSVFALKLPGKNQYVYYYTQEFGEKW